uniref:Uncharacterized protein n=1 Tax=Ciona savignyi TaxID=51511 RepID=H2YFN3_CIOSA
MVLLRLVQHMTLFVSGKHPTFGDLIRDYCNHNLPLLVRRVRALLRYNEKQTDLAEALENSNVEGTSSGESVTATIKVTAERSQETEHNLDYPLLPLSKGVIMSLGQKLDLMVSAATRAGLYKE